MSKDITDDILLRAGFKETDRVDDTHQIIDGYHLMMINIK